MRNKEFTRDYATAAFRFYAARGQPTYEEEERRIREETMEVYRLRPPEEQLLRAETAVKRRAAELLDILAVDGTVKLLRQNGRGFVWRAVELVYFGDDPDLPLHKNELSERVRRASRVLCASESQIYRHLREARRLFASLRGLRTAQMFTGGSQS